MINKSQQVIIFRRKDHFEISSLNFDYNHIRYENYYPIFINIILKKLIILFFISLLFIFFFLFLKLVLTSPILIDHFFKNNCLIISC